MVFLKKALFSWNECSKNADISILSNFLAFLQLFSQYREILPNTIYVPSFSISCLVPMLKRFEVVKIKWINGKKSKQKSIKLIQFVTPYCLHVN